MHSPGATVFVGHRTGGEGSGPIALSEPGFAAVTVTPLDGAALDRSNKILITACGRCENTDMVFSSDRTTVGAHWGKGPATDCEQEHLRDMLAGLPAQTLLLIDAGYRGFNLLGSILDSGRDFIVRVGSNTTLLKDLDYDVQDKGSTLWLWPKAEQGQRPPLKLRKVEFKSKGHRVCLLSSVLSGEGLSDAQIKRLYRQRWGIEVQYRKLLSDSPPAARAELDWCLLGLWLLELMQVGSRHWKRSRRYSFATLLRVVRKAMRSRCRVPAGGLERQLRQAMLDGYERKKPKQARDYPCKKRLKPCGYPRIRMATQRETLKAQAFFAEKVPA